MHNRYLGIDLGTSSAKGLLVNADGGQLGRAQHAYPTRRPRPRWAEQQVPEWKVAIRRLVQDLTPDGDVAAVAVAGHTPTMVAMDGERRQTRPAITWQDTRATAEAAELAEQFGDERKLVGATLPWNAAYLPAKLLWLARHDQRPPRWLMQPKDAVNFALTGIAATDIWGSKGLCRVDNGNPVYELFDYSAIPIHVLPPRLRPWQPLGVVDPAGAAWSGLPAGTTVAVGWTDALAGMLSIGVFREPRAFALTGTSDIVGMSHPDVPPDAQLLHVPASCAPAPVQYGPSQASGAALLWLAGLFHVSVEDLLSESAAADEANVPCFVPYLDGERAPVWRTDVRASLSGVSAGTGRAELARAVLRGVALSNRHILDLAGHHNQPVHVGGAPALTAGWVRARLETYGSELVLHQQPQLTALGAAMLAAVAHGRADITSVSEAMSSPVVRHRPDATTTRQADARYAEYLRDVAAALAAGDGKATKAVPPK